MIGRGPSSDLWPNSFRRSTHGRPRRWGRAAVGHALDGETNRMVSIVRVADEPYTTTTGLTPLEPVAGAHKKIPPEYLDSEGMPTGAFLDYARPLIGDPLPTFGRIA